MSNCKSARYSIDGGAERGVGVVIDGGPDDEAMHVLSLPRLPSIESGEEAADGETAAGALPADAPENRAHSAASDSGPPPVALRKVKTSMTHHSRWTYVSPAMISSRRHPVRKTGSSASDVSI